MPIALQHPRVNGATGTDLMERKHVGLLLRVDGRCQPVLHNRLADVDVAEQLDHGVRPKRSIAWAWSVTVEPTRSRVCSSLLALQNADGVAIAMGETCEQDCQQSQVQTIQGPLCQELGHADWEQPNRIHRRS